MILRSKQPARTLYSIASILAVVALAQAGAPPGEPLPPPPLPPTTLPAGGLMVDVTSFEFEGNTAIPSEELRAAAEAKLSDFGTRRITSEQLEEIRKAVTAVYTGTEAQPRFINSGAVLPDQSLDGGVVLFQIIEGRLSDIEVGPVALEGEPDRKLWIRTGYIRDRALHRLTAPLYLPDLQERLELLRTDANIARLNAELQPGTAPGESRLKLMIDEAERYTAALSFNNHHSVSSGAEEFEAYFTIQDLTGFGDRLNLRYGITTGGFDDMQFAGLDDFSVIYSLPISPSDTTLTFAFDRSTDAVIEEPFADLDIDSESFNVGLTLRQPLYRTPTTELAIFASVEYRENKTKLLGDNFSFSPGAEDGKTRVFPLRFGQEFSYANPSGGWAFAARSVFTVGTDWFTGNSASRRDDLGNELEFYADAQFLSWLGQVQHVRRLFENRNERLVLRGGAQLADDSLLSIEQFSIGGINSVRGYRENRIVRDQGLTGTAELRIPLLQRGARTVLELVPFADVGYGFNHNSDFEGSEFISSVGAGLVFEPNEHFLAEVYYGYPLNKFPDRDDLQDLGIHFNLVLQTKW